MTPEQRQRLCEYSDTCAQAVSSIHAASQAVEELARDIANLIATAETPEEKRSWEAVRFNCFTVVGLLAEAAFRFEKG